MNEMYKPLKLLAQLVCVAAAVITPWFFGGVQARVQVWLFVAAAAALACWILWAMAASLGGRRAEPARLPAVVLFVLLGVALGVGQLVPLPPALLVRLSPEAARLRAELLVDEPLPGRPPASEAASAEDCTQPAPLGTVRGGGPSDPAPQGPSSGSFGTARKTLRASSPARQATGSRAPGRWPLAVRPFAWSPGMLGGEIGRGAQGTLPPFGRTASSSRSPAARGETAARLAGGRRLEELVHVVAFQRPGASRPGADGLDRQAVLRRLGEQPYPLSLNPAATRRDLLTLAMAAAFGLLAGNLFHGRRALQRLCLAAAVGGAALALFGIVQQLRWTGRLYWAVPLSQGGVPFGPFVNRNNAGGYLNLCLAAALGLVVWAFTRHGAAHADDYAGWDGSVGVGAGRASLMSRLVDRLSRFVGELDGAKLSALTLLAAIGAGVLCTLSRGATLGMVGAATVTLVCSLAARRRAAAAVLAAAAGLAAVGLVQWVDRLDAVQARLATLFEENALEKARMHHWRDTLRVAPHFWRAGSGLGSYRYVYKAYAARDSTAWFYHSENQYLEALTDAGVAGLGLLAAAIAAAAAAVWRLFRRARQTGHYATAAVACFALTSQVITACFDFGLFIPANIVLCAVILGAVVGRAGGKPAPGSAVGVAACLLLASVLGALEAQRAAAVETAVQAARLAVEGPAEGGAKGPTGWPRTDQALRLTAMAVRQAELAVRRRPDDVDARRIAAICWTHAYRLRAYQSLRDEQRRRIAADPEAERLTRDQLWRLASPLQLYVQSVGLRRQAQLERLAQLQRHPVVLRTIPQAYRHLVLARAACPTWAELHWRLAQLCWVAGETEPQADVRHLARAERLAPADAELQYRCGLMHFRAGRIDACCRAWRASLSASSRFERPILELAVPALTPRQLADQLLPDDDPQLMLRVVDQRFAGRDQGEARALLLDRAAKALERSGLSEAERLYVSSQIQQRCGRLDEAARELEAALLLDPNQLEWRYQLALVLEQRRRWDAAHQHARLAARMAPRDARIRRLLQRLQRARLTGRP